MWSRFVKNTLVCVGVALSLSVTACTPQRNTFTALCKKKRYLSEETRHTVEVLLETIRNEDCLAAGERLSTMTELFLYDNEITDISPLCRLTNLTHLSLGNNLIIQSPKVSC